jgi:Leucine-rich repeat (LRR) protein
MRTRLIIGGIIGAIVGALLVGGVVVARLGSDTASPLMIEESQNGTSQSNNGTGSSLVVGEGVTLDLSGRGLTEVPKDIFTRIDVERLNLSRNNLTGSLPAEVRHLENLRVLDLSYNKFTGVPAEVGQLSKLQVLDLSYNNLTGLPNELGALIHLEVLDLRGNAYSAADLAVIKKTLPGSVRILVD